MHPCSSFSSPCSITALTVDERGRLVLRTTYRDDSGASIHHTRGPRACLKLGDGDLVFHAGRGTGVDAEALHHLVERGGLELEELGGLLLHAVGELE